MDHHYDQGWRRYSYVESSMSEVKAHGADVSIRAAGVIDRGPGDLRISLLELPPHSDGDVIGLHIHRDTPTGVDVEEIYTVISGRGVMSFTNGTEVPMCAGDVVTTYPGTGHAVRVTGTDPMRIVVVVPVSFRTDRTTVEPEALPQVFYPHIRVAVCDSSTMVPLEAECTGCGRTWSTGDGVRDLREWASVHGNCTGGT